MKTIDEWSGLDRFMQLRENIFSCIDRMIEEDPHHKSYEGRFTIHSPGRFDDDKEDAWSLEFHCYLIVPHTRHAEWVGRTWGEVITAAEKDIMSWIEEVDYEMDLR